MIDRRNRVEVVAAQKLGVREHTGLTKAQTDRAAWLVGDVDGVRVAAGGPRAVGLLVAVAWRTRLPLLPWRLPLVPRMLDALYGWIAENRRRFPGATPWCVEHAGECHPQPDAAT